jgi:2-iminobutanoate/2-iminopropanoate deaminase
VLKEVRSDKVAAPIGPYSQAVLAGNILYISGQLGLDVQTGQIVSEGIQAQTKVVLDSVEAILAVHNAGWNCVARVEIFLVDLNDFKIVNEMYATRVTHSVKPARQTMQVARLPRDALIEISCIAHL